MEHYYTNVTSGTPTAMTFPVTWNGTYSVVGAPVAPTVPQSPLEWLDAEVEKICALARL